MKFFRVEVPLWIVILAAFALTIFLGIYAQSQYSSGGQLLPWTDLNASTTFVYGSRPELSQVKFFEAAKDGFIAGKADFIEADLSAMTIRVYKGGIAVKAAPILTKGREGSWWETPAGLYKVESKEKNHFSSFGRVYQPWSVAFEGNFFIHGWPYYKDGTPVDSSYSGGCIRLSTADAQAVYDLAYVGMPVLVYEKSFASDNFIYEENAPRPSASSSYLVADLKNNLVFLEKNKSQTLPIASITKLMTALVATEYINLEEKISIPADAIVLTSKPRLSPGQTVTIYNLLFPLLLESSNEAALSLGDYLGKTRSLKLMNAKAQALGMTQTHFADTSGASPENLASAEDLFTFAKYLYNNRSFILKITSGHLAANAYGESVFARLENFNLFDGDPRFLGGKIGETAAADETFLGVFQIPVSGENRPIAVIILHDDARLKDHITAILDWIAARYAGVPAANQTSQ